MDMKNGILKYYALVVLFFTYSITGMSQIQQVGEELDLADDYDLYIFKKGDKYALAQDSNNAVFKYDSILRQRSFYDFVFVKQGNLWGILQDDSTELLPTVYEDIYNAYYYEDSNQVSTFVIKREGKYGSVDRHNNIKIPIVYDNITTWIGKAEGGHYVMSNNEIGYVNRDGDIKIPIGKYDSIAYNRELDWYKVKKGNFMGMVDGNDSIKIPIIYTCLFDDYFYLNEDGENKIVVQKDGLWSYLNKNGKVLQRKIPEDTIKTKYEHSDFSNYDFKYTFISMLDDIMTHQIKSFPISDTYNALLNFIVNQKGKITVSFPGLHKTNIDYIPDPFGVNSFFALKQALLSRGFRIVGNGYSGLGKIGEFAYTITASKDECTCFAKIGFYYTSTPGQYEMIEQLECY